MEMLVRDAAERLPLQPRGIEVCDVIHLAIQQVQDIGAELDLPGRRVADLQVEQARCTRAFGIVFDEGPRPEVAKPRAAAPRALFIRNTRGQSALRRAGNELSCAEVFLEARSRQR